MQLYKGGMKSTQVFASDCALKALKTAAFASFSSWWSCAPPGYLQRQELLTYHLRH